MALFNRGLDDYMDAATNGMLISGVLLRSPTEAHRLIGEIIDKDMQRVAEKIDDPRSYDRSRRRYETVKDAYEDYLEARKKFEAALKEAEQAKEKKPETSI